MENHRGNDTTYQKAQLFSPDSDNVSRFQERLVQLIFMDQIESNQWAEQLVDHIINRNINH